MKWWKKILRTQGEAFDDGVAARIHSEHALKQTEALGPKVRYVSSSLKAENANNHYARRLAMAYGLLGEDHT